MTEKEIKQRQEQRQKPLTEREDAMESLENVILDTIRIQEEYEQLQKEVNKDFSFKIPLKKIV